MPSKSNYLFRMTIDISEADHKRLKALAAVLGKSMRELVADWIHGNLYSDSMPNKTTVKAIESVEKGKKDPIEADDAQDLFRQLGI